MKLVQRVREEQRGRQKSPKINDIFFCEYNNVNKPYVYNGIKTKNTAIYFRVKEPDWFDTPHKDLFL